MISFHVNAVCFVRDGYTGLPILPSALLCRMDGQPCRPVGKNEGYLVFTNLTPGLHRLSLQCAGYQEEWVDFTVGSAAVEMDITMKPGRGYAFRTAFTRLTVTVLRGGVPAANALLWVAAPSVPEIKVAQTKAEAGSDTFRVFCKGSVRPRTPAPYLIHDKKNSEIIRLIGMEGEMGQLEKPLLFAHGRSRLLMPAQSYHTDEKGCFPAVFTQPCTAEVFSQEGGLLASVTLEEGENTVEVTLP